MIAAPHHLARRGMNPSVRPRERHADAETKAGPDTALPKLPVVPLGLRHWDRGTGRDISPPMTWYGTTAAGPMCAALYGGTSLERRGHPAAMFSPGALYTLLDCGGHSPWGSLGRSFVNHAGTAVDSMGDTCGSRGGMVSCPRSWHTPCRAWYWCQATRSLRSIRIVRGMWSHRGCGMRRQETWCRSAADALFHHSVIASCHGPQVLSHMLRNATFQRMQWRRRLWTVVS